MRDIDELKRASADVLRGARDQRQDRAARDRRDGPIFDAFEKMSRAAADGTPAAFAGDRPGPRHHAQLSLVDDDERKIDDESELLRAITLTQPWAGWMAAGIKLIENRTRPMIKRSHIGKRIALHASREFDESVILRIGEIAPEIAWPTGSICEVPSAVIAVATLADILDIGRDREPLPGFLDLEFAAAVKRGTVAVDQRRWYFQRVGYVLRDVRLLREPAHCRGWQGFWTLDRATNDRVLSLLEAA
jgi:hypothetical protein